MTILYCYKYVVVKNGHFTLFVTSHGQEWYFCHDIHRKTLHFLSKSRHVMLQMDCLGKTSPVVRVSTHIYGVFEEIDWKMYIFRVNLDM